MSAEQRGGRGETPREAPQGSSLPPTPIEPEPQAGAPDERQQREAERQEATQRRMRNLILALVLGLLVLTTYFFALNVYVLLRQTPQPYTLSFERAADVDAGAYRAVVRWEPLAGAEHPVRPRLLLDGTELPEWDEAQSASAPLLRLDGSYALRVDFTPATTGGLHRGEVVLNRHQGPDNLPTTLTVPVSVGITGGFWANWFVLRDWLIVVLVVATALYVFCILVFPAPRGRMAFESRMGTVPVRRSARFRVRRIAWLFPWLRSTVPLTWVWKTAGMTRPPDVDGELVFFAERMPALRVRDRHRARLRQGLLDHRVQDLTRAAGLVAVRGSPIMRPDRVFLFEATEGGARHFFRYEP